MYEEKSVIQSNGKGTFWPILKKMVHEALNWYLRYMVYIGKSVFWCKIEKERFAIKLCF